MRKFENYIRRKDRQMGGLTVFTAILVLILLTAMVFYAARVGLFEQRVSANEVRQKIAFHAAEAALDQGTQYLMANGQLILSNAPDSFPPLEDDGTLRDGWFAENRWVACDGTNTLLENHPCGGETPMKVGSFFYDDPDTITGVDSLPLGTTGFSDGVTARLSANICFVEVTTPNPTTCEANPLTVLGAAESHMLITLLAYGFSDCTDTTDVSTCSSEATVAVPIANYKSLAGSPTVPLVSKSTFPPNGTAFVVPNPNGGGVGVPISAWINSNGTTYPDGSNVPADCRQTEVDVLSRGTWNTCEMQEWYGRNEVPAATACDQPSCTCREAESISFKKTGTETILGIDIVADNEFPCDLFEFFFNVADTDYENGMKAGAVVLDDCSTLDESSSGLYWISGNTCSLNNVTLGSPDNPIILISAATETHIVGSVEIFGVLYIFDGEDPLADISGAGGATIFGALIVDATIDKFTGSFDVVYAPAVLAKAGGLNSFGSVNGGWRDFGLPDLAW